MVKNIISIIAAIIALQGCSPSLFDCSDEIKAEARSPDGKYVATWYERDCGATTSASTFISLRPSQEAFKADDGVVFVSKGILPIKLTWDDAKTLRVECPPCLQRDVFKEEQLWNGVGITYIRDHP